MPSQSLKWVHLYDDNDGEARVTSIMRLPGGVLVRTVIHDQDADGHAGVALGVSLCHVPGLDLIDGVLVERQSAEAPSLVTGQDSGWRVYNLEDLDGAPLDQVLLHTTWDDEKVLHELVMRGFWPRDHQMTFVERKGPPPP